MLWDYFKSILHDDYFIHLHRNVLQGVLLYFLSVFLYQHCEFWSVFSVAKLLILPCILKQLTSKFPLMSGATSTRHKTKENFIRKHNNLQDPNLEKHKYSSLLNINIYLFSKKSVQIFIVNLELCRILFTVYVWMLTWAFISLYFADTTVNEIFKFLVYTYALAFFFFYGKEKKGHSMEGSEKKEMRSRW